MAGILEEGPIRRAIRRLTLEEKPRVTSKAYLDLAKWHITEAERLLKRRPPFYDYRDTLIAIEEAERALATAKAILPR